MIIINDKIIIIYSRSEIYYEKYMKRNFLRKTYLFKYYVSY